MSKKIISVILAFVLTFSMFTVAGISASAQIDENGAYVPGPNVTCGTNRYYFWMPDSWYNEKFGATNAGCYWWNGTDSGAEWPGYKMQVADKDLSLYYIDCPKDVMAFALNNLIDGGNRTLVEGTTDKYTYDFSEEQYFSAMQTIDTAATYYSEGDDEFYNIILSDENHNAQKIEAAIPELKGKLSYEIDGEVYSKTLFEVIEDAVNGDNDSFFGDGTYKDNFFEDSKWGYAFNFDNMICMVDIDNPIFNDFSNKDTYFTEWYFYYGNGEYGPFPNKEWSEAIGMVMKFSGVATPDEPTDATPDEPSDDTPDEPAETLFGDVDLDGELTVQDATAIQQYIVNISEFNYEQFKLADFDGDGDITVSDATGIQKMIVGLVESEPEDDDTPKTIMFDVKSSGWSNVKTVFCHIWKADGTKTSTGEDWPAFQGKAEKCTYDASTGIATYDLSQTGHKFSKSDGKLYCVIFSANTGRPTYNVIMDGSCIGDTLYCTGKKLENPVDSCIIANEAAWRNNPDCGPERRITSTGKIIGNTFPKGENDVTMMADFLVAYYDDAAMMDLVPNLMKELNLKNEYVMGAVNDKLKVTGNMDADVISKSVAATLGC